MVGESQRFEKVYVGHYDAVLRYCLRRSSSEDAMDAAAEVFVVAWRRRSEMPEGHELPWLYGVARRVLAHQRRADDRRSATVARLRAVGSPVDAGPESQVVVHEEIRLMVAAADRLGEADQEVLRLAGWEELDRDELAAALGCSANAATKRLNRALDRLAYELGVARRSRGRFFSRRRVAR